MRGTQFAQLTAFVAVAEHCELHQGGHISRHLYSVAQPDDPFPGRAIRRPAAQPHHPKRGIDRGRGGAARSSEPRDGRHATRRIDAVNAFRDKPAGTLRLTVHPVAAVTVIAPLVARFSAEYPEIRLEICVDDECKDIVSERFDAGIHLGEGIAQDMIAIPIGGKFRLSTVASPDYLARSAPLSVPDDLKQHNCIKYCWAGDDAGHSWKFRNADRQVDVERRRVVERERPRLRLARRPRRPRRRAIARRPGRPIRRRRQIGSACWRTGPRNGRTSSCSIRADVTFRSSCARWSIFSAGNRSSLPGLKAVT